MIALTELKQMVSKYLYLEDHKLIELILAVALSRTQPHSKLWLIIIGKSGDGKSELLRLLDDGGKTTKLIRQLTAHTFVNGHNNKKKYPDLAPLLKNKIILMPEMASILTCNLEEQQHIWGQMRDLYDGIAGKQSGQGLDIDYQNLNISFIGCSTPDIDKKVLLNQSLGTREFLYRCEEKDEALLMNRIIENTTLDKSIIRKELQAHVQTFLSQHTFTMFNIESDIEERIKHYARLTSILRVTADIEHESGELYNFIYPEQPTRILEQYVTLFRCLMSLDANYTPERAFDVIEKVMLSSCDPVRIEVLLFLLKNHLLKEEGFSKREVAKEISISPKKAYSVLNILSAPKVNLLHRKVNIDELQDKSYSRFKVNTLNPLVHALAESLRIGKEVYIEPSLLKEVFKIQ